MGKCTPYTSRHRRAAISNNMKTNFSWKLEPKLDLCSSETKQSRRPKEQSSEMKGKAEKKSSRKNLARSMGEWKTSKWTGTLIRMNALRELQLTFKMRFFISKLGSIYGFVPPSLSFSSEFSKTLRDWVSFVISRFNALENNCLSLNKNHFVLLAAELLLLLLLTIRFTACVLCALLIDMKFDGAATRDRYSNFPSLIYFSIW